ncbi:MAG TPA: Lrp/AsnC family transcriptional regulator [Fimbriimonadaceae bacterium]|nr:Lrp/AsnC family transcriptional regulator [Fimbriimonadaceae bacterium]
MDAIDYAILVILQSEGRITNAELASRIGLTPGPVLARVNKLEASGLIQGYTAVLDRERLGFPVTVFVAVIVKSHDQPTCDSFVRAVNELDEVLECHHIAGDEDYLLKVVAQSPADYERFTTEKLATIPSIQRIKTTFVLSSSKSTSRIPLESRK